MKDKQRDKEEGSIEIVLATVTLLIIGSFIGYMLYLLISSNFAGYVAAKYTCPPGMCVTDINSGAKTCPIGSTAELQYEPSTQTCNSSFLCDSPLTPYALLSDSSTNNQGICEPGVACNCLQSPQCPSYILSVFTIQTGNPYNSSTSGATTFTQTPNYISGTTVVPTPPIKYTNPSTTFCTVTNEWLVATSPGCNFMDPFAVTCDQIVTCFGMGTGCAESPKGNPCSRGTLAYIAPVDSVTSETYSDTLLGCVAGDPCPCGSMAIYDPTYGVVSCRQVSGCNILS